MHAVPSLVVKLLFKWRHGNVIPQRDLCSIIPDPCLSMSYDLLSNEARVRLLVVISSWDDVHNCDIVYFIFSVMCQIRDIILCKDVYMVGKINDKPNTCRAFVLQLYTVSLYIYIYIYICSQFRWALQFLMIVLSVVNEVEGFILVYSYI